MQDITEDEMLSVIRDVLVGSDGKPPCTLLAFDEIQQYIGDEEGYFYAASNWHLGRVLMQPTDMPDQVFATFLADDDDGNLDNGTFYSFDRPGVP